MADPQCMTVALVSMESNGTLLEARHPPCYGPYYTLVGEIALPGNPDEDEQGSSRGTRYVQHLSIISTRPMGLV